MGRIKILPEVVVNQIAAGEVVERAASVLKELIENSLDAGASRIQVIIKGAGRSLVQVIDDGSGMPREDLHLAFERHATSKLSCAEDLVTVRTMGFRGEALPSIASVSVIEVRSRPEGSGSGTLLRIEGGHVVHEEPVAAPRGTSVAVHSLFYNTPARARFLKSDATELAHLSRTFKQYALAYPEIYWSLTHDSAAELLLPAAAFLVRLEDLFGSGFGDRVLPVAFESGGISVSGVIGKSELNKKSRGDQFLYLNRRPVQSTLLHSAVRAALREQLEEGAWPFYVLFLEMDSTQFDVNVHPAKLEVKFADERLVHGGVFRAVRSALPREVTSLGIGTGNIAELSSSGGGAVANPAFENLRGLDFSAPPQPLLSGTMSDGIPKSELGTASPYRPAILQVHSKYLITPIQSGIAIVDQHAAHERILFEKAQRSFRERMFNSQQLLFPMLLELTLEEEALFEEIRENLDRLGFQIREFGTRAYSVEAVPAGIPRASETGMIHEMLDEYAEFRRENFSPQDALAAGFACRAAIRAGDALTAEEMTSLIDELFATEFPLTCPHGRPTVVHIKLSELDHRFKRTG